jgi:CheY-like chemotaxis protein/DNA-directed RNA polymerase subunit RPC12/RpoP
MKIEVRCSACGKGYLVDSESSAGAGDQVSCPACGAAIEIPGAARSVRAPVPSPAAEVHCPRCGLHFVPATRRDLAASAVRPTVLVVEDMDYFYEIVRDALSGGYEVTHARTVAEAVASVKAAPPDVMLLDLMLDAGEDGLAVLRALPTRPFPVLVVTAQDEAEMYGEEWRRLSALGVSDVVRKGMNMSEMLLRKVGAALGETNPQSTLRD